MDKVKIYDLQLEKYTNYTSIEELYEHIQKSYCECGEGYDELDEKDGRMKCSNCWSLNNIEKISKENMLKDIYDYGYRVEWVD